MVRQALRPNPKRQQTAQPVSLPAPVGGWDASSPLASMPIQNAVILDNWIPRSSSCEVRRGFVPQCTSAPAAVETLMAYRGGASGDKLFAATNGGIYDATTAGSVFGAALVSGFTSNRWNSFHFANSAGEWLIALNGSDTPQGYNAGTWGALPTITGTGLTASNLFCGTSHQGRAFYAEKNTLHVWYPAAGAVGGAVTLLDLGSIFTKGGRIIALETWSWQFGVTADQYFVIMTDQGQIALYSGTDPSNASDWALTGVYDFGTPIGPRSLVKYGADLVIVSSDGIVPMSQAMKLDRSQDDTVALTAKIAPAFAEVVRAYRTNYGWQGILYPGATTSSSTTATGGSLAIFNIPVTTLGTSIQFVQNMATGAWARFPSGLNAFCWEIANNCIYFGSTAGVYQWDVGASDNGVNITASVLGAFNNWGAPVTKKAVMVRPLLNAPGIVTPAVDINADYNQAMPTATPSVVNASVSAQIRYAWTGATGMGYMMAPAMQVTISPTSGSDTLGVDTTSDSLLTDGTGDVLAVDSGLPFDVEVSLIGFDVLYERGGQL